MNPTALLLDVEGTTTPIAFVYEVLFPHAKERGPDFLREHWDDPEIRTARTQLAEENGADQIAGAPKLSGQSDLIDYYLWLIEHDRKSTPLKTIQGLVWRQAYAMGEIKGQVFDDVRPALERWQAEGRRVAIYSSGSVQAQRDLFRYSNHGDLSALINAYFDTNIGSKKRAESYVSIARALTLDENRILFASDSLEELTAAESAGLATVLSVRPGNPATPSHTYRIISSLPEIC